MTDKAKKVGRPKKDNANNVRLAIRVDETLKSKIDKYCKKNNTTISKMLRTAITDLLTEK